MRTISVKIPDEFCNECVFFGIQRGSEMGFKSYWCRLFNVRLAESDLIHGPDPDEWNLGEHKNVNPIHKVYPCLQCKKDAVQGEKKS